MSLDIFYFHATFNLSTFETLCRKKVQFLNNFVMSTVTFSLYCSCFISKSTFFSGVVGAVPVYPDVTRDRPSFSLVDWIRWSNFPCKSDFSRCNSVRFDVSVCFPNKVKIVTIEFETNMLYNSTVQHCKIQHMYYPLSKWVGWIHDLQKSSPKKKKQWWHSEICLCANKRQLKKKDIGKEQWNCDKYRKILTFSQMPPLLLNVDRL